MIIKNKTKNSFQKISLSECKVVQQTYISLFLADGTEEDKKLFLGEIEMMKRLGKHRNVVSMIGCWTFIEPIFLIVEYVPHGDLLTYLRKRRKSLVRIAELDKFRTEFKFSQKETSHEGLVHSILTLY